MLPVCGKPILQRQLEFFSGQGIRDITITVGYRAESIMDYFGDGSRFGVKLRYIREDEPLGTAGSLRFADVRPNLLLVVNGDIIFDIDLARMLAYHRDKQADVTLFTHPNQHPYDSAVIITDAEGRVIRWLNKEDERADVPNRVNAGVHLISRAALDFESAVWQNKKIDLDRDILKPGVARKRIFAYICFVIVFAMNMITSRNLKNRQKAIFLDRDGTINRHVGFLRRAEQLELLDGAAEAIGRINKSEYLALVASNQPVIARGECSFSEMERIHNRMASLLGQRGAYLNDVVFCPHHPHSGFPGEVRELKIDCDCRKPTPGLLLALAEKYNIDLSASYMIGDDLRDVKAGRVAGCRTVYIGKEKSAVLAADHCAGSLSEAVELILGGHEDDGAGKSDL